MQGKKIIVTAEIPEEFSYSEGIYTGRQAAIDALRQKVRIRNERVLETF